MPPKKQGTAPPKAPQGTNSGSPKAEIPPEGKRSKDDEQCRKSNRMILQRRRGVPNAFEKRTLKEKLEDSLKKDVEKGGVVFSRPTTPGTRTKKKPTRCFVVATQLPVNSTTKTALEKPAE